MKNILAIIITALIVFGLGWSIYKLGILLTIVGLVLGAAGVWAIWAIYMLARITLETIRGN